MATANSLGSVPAVLRETMSVIELPGYTDADKRVIAAAHLLPWQLGHHGRTADQVRVTDEAIEAMIGGYTSGAGVWDLTDALATVCAKVVRRRAEGDEAPLEVTPEILAGMLGPPSHRKAEVAARTGRTGVRGRGVPIPGSRRATGACRFRTTLSGRTSGGWISRTATCLPWILIESPLGVANVRETSRQLSSGTSAPCSSPVPRPAETC